MAKFQINKEFYEKLDKAIDTIPSKEEAEKFIDSVLVQAQKQALDTLNKVWAPVEKKLSPYLAYYELIKPIINFSVSITSIVDFAKAVIKAYTGYIEIIKAEISPYITMYENAEEYLLSVPPEIQKLQAHLKAKIAEKDWDVDVPDVTFPILPPLPPIPDILKE